MEICEEYSVSNSKIIICKGNLCHSKCDVIVSSDDNLVTQGGGVSQKLAQYGGMAIANDAKKQIPSIVGNVIVTSAGNLPQKLIFHAITIDKFGEEENFIHEFLPEEQDIQKYIISHSVKKCLKLLTTLDFNSIAFPVIGSGHAGIPFGKAVACIIETFYGFLKKTSKNLRIELWYYGDEFCDVSDIIENCGRQEQSDLKEETRDDDSFVFNPQNQNPQVFISYSRLDLPMAKSVCSLLDEIKIPYWIDVNNIYSGNNYKTEIVRILRKVKLVVFLSSKHANASGNVCKEIGLAVKGKKYIIPLKLDDAPYADEIEYDLAFMDYIDFSVDIRTALDKLRIAVLANVNKNKNI